MRQAIMGSRAGDDVAPGAFADGIRRGFSSFVLTESDNTVHEPVDIAPLGGGMFGLYGLGIHASNIGKGFSGGSMFYDSSGASWRPHVHGVSLQGDPNDTDGFPLFTLPNIDGGSFRSCGAHWSGGRGFDFPGICSETVFDTVEVSRCRYEGLRAERMRNVVWQGMNRAERNARADFRAYAGIYWKGDPFDRGHSTISGQFNLEHDERDHWGMVLDGVQGVSIPGRLRLVQAGFKTLPNCDHIEIGPVTRYKEPGTINLPRVDLKGTNLVYDMHRWVTVL